MKQTILDRFPMFERHVTRLETIRKIRLSYTLMTERQINICVKK